MAASALPASSTTSPSNPSATPTREAIDDGYRTKYGNSSYVDAMVTPTATAATLRIVPNDKEQP